MPFPLRETERMWRKMPLCRIDHYGTRHYSIPRFLFFQWLSRFLLIISDCSHMKIRGHHQRQFWMRSAESAEFCWSHRKLRLVVPSNFHMGGVANDEHGHWKNGSANSALWKCLYCADFYMPTERDQNVTKPYETLSNATKPYHTLPNPIAT